MLIIGNRDYYKFNSIIKKLDVNNTEIIFYNAETMLIVLCIMQITLAHAILFANQ